MNRAGRVYFRLVTAEVACCLIYQLVDLSFGLQLVFNRFSCIVENLLFDSIRQ